MTTTPPANPYAAAPRPLTPEDEKLWSTLTHLAGLVFGFIGLPFLGALIAYLALRERGPFVRWHTAQALNFQLTLIIGYIVGGVLTLVLIGFVVLFVVWILSVVLAIMAAVAANRGDYYRYPLTITFVS